MRERETGGSWGLVRLNPKQKTSYLHMKSPLHDYTLTHTSVLRPHTRLVVALTSISFCRHETTFSSSPPRSYFSCDFKFFFYHLSNLVLFEIRNNFLFVYLKLNHNTKEHEESYLVMNHSANLVCKHILQAEAAPQIGYDSFPAVLCNFTWKYQRSVVFNTVILSATCG